MKKYLMQLRPFSLPWPVFLILECLIVGLIFGIAFGENWVGGMVFAELVKPNGVLLDSVHANEHSHHGLTEEEYDYHRLSGFRVAFDYLKFRGLPCTRWEGNRLTPEILAPYQVFFINLVSAERPPFLVSEIAAIKEFVEGGGSLFVITDHSNCYFHAHILQPLFEELGQNVTTDTACDKTPFTIGRGNGWIRITTFCPHPITKSLRNVIFQTGGTVDERFAVALTSTESWSDTSIIGPYGEADSLGHFGNFRQDDGEKNGPLGIILARKFGKGKIVQVADQNVFSDPMIFYADHAALWLNCMEWLTNTDDNDTHFDNTVFSENGLNIGGVEEFQSFYPERRQKIRIICAENFDTPLFGSGDVFGLWNVYTFLQRRFVVVANDRWDVSADVILIGNGYYPLQPETISLIATHLQKGGKVVALHTGSDVLEDDETSIAQIIQRLATEQPAAELPQQEQFRHEKVDRYRYKMTISGTVSGGNNGNGDGVLWLISPSLDFSNEVTNGYTVRPTVFQQELWDELVKNVVLAVNTKSSR